MRYRLSWSPVRGKRAPIKIHLKHLYEFNRLVRHELHIA